MNGILCLLSEVLEGVVEQFLGRMGFMYQIQDGYWEGKLSKINNDNEKHLHNSPWFYICLSIIFFMDVSTLVYSFLLRF